MAKAISFLFVTPIRIWLKLNSKPQKYNENKSAKEFLKEELPYLIKLAQYHH